MPHILQLSPLLSPLPCYQLAINTASGAVLGRPRCCCCSPSQDSAWGTATSRNHRPLSTALGSGDCSEAASPDEGLGLTTTSEGGGATSVVFGRRWGGAWSRSIICSGDGVGIRAVAFDEKGRTRGRAALGLELERRLLADRREPAERVLGTCALRRGDSTALLLPVLLVDAPERARVRLDVVSRRCWRCFLDSEVLVLPVAGDRGSGFSPLLESFPAEDEESLNGVMVVRWGKPIAVSDLYRGRVRGTISIADVLTPAEAE